MKNKIILGLLVLALVLVGLYLSTQRQNTSNSISNEEARAILQEAIPKTLTLNAYKQKAHFRLQLPASKDFLADREANLTIDGKIKFNETEQSAQQTVEVELNEAMVESFDFGTKDSWKIKLEGIIHNQKGYLKILFVQSNFFDANKHGSILNKWVDLGDLLTVPSDEKIIETFFEPLQENNLIDIFATSQPNPAESHIFQFNGRVNKDEFITLFKDEVLSEYPNQPERAAEVIQYLEGIEREEYPELTFLVDTEEKIVQSLVVNIFLPEQIYQGEIEILPNVPAMNIMASFDIQPQTPEEVIITAPKEFLTIEEASKLIGF